MSTPLFVTTLNGKTFNEDGLKEDLQSFTEALTKVSKGRLISYSQEVNHLKYNPVGYVLSAVKDREDEKMFSREKMIEKRIERIKTIKDERIK